MNIFKTAPKFIQGYLETKRFTKLTPEIRRLREEGKYEEERELIWAGQKRWVENGSVKLGLTYEVYGEENIPKPEDGPFMIYSNHQGFGDIPATLWLMRNHGQIGYITKEEWKKYAIFRDVVDCTRSIFLQRNNPREAVRALSVAKDITDKGFNLCVFPEGTRSQCHEMGEFKPGAFKFAEKAGVPILPVTVDGSFQFFEEKKSYQPAHIKVTAHPVVHIEKMTKEEQKEAAKLIEKAIRSGLDKNFYKELK